MKKTISLTLAVMMLLCALAGCGSEPAVETAPASTPPSTVVETPLVTAEPEPEGRTYPYTFTDMAGVEITLEKPVETVYIVGSVQPLVPLYRYYRGTSEGLLGCPAASQSILAGSVLAEVWPDMLEVEPHADDVNAEEILALNPDIVFMTGSATGDAYDAFINAGLNVVSFPTAGSGDDTDTFATVANWLAQMGELFDDAAPAEELVEHNDAVLSEVTAMLSDVAEEDKPSVMIIFQLNDNGLTVAGSDHYSEFWIDKTGGINAAGEIEKLSAVDIEQVMSWNPDIIYITTFSPAMPDDLYNNTIEGYDWSQVRAVQEQQVYKIPLGSYRWYAPNCEVSLMLKWMASINHPEIFKDMDMNAEVADFFGTFYGVVPSDEQIAAMLNPADKSLMSH